MYQIVQGTYQDGRLILNKKLDSEMEGKVLQVVVFEAGKTKDKKAQFLHFVASKPVVLPEGYHFDREELYDR